MDCSKEQSETKTLALDGDCTLDRVLELKDVLLEALKDGASLKLDLREVASADLSFLQLLCSAHRAALKHGQELTFGPLPSAAFTDAVECAGFCRAMGCQDAPNSECLFMEVMKNG